MKSQSLLNVGILHELLGEYTDALECYKEHLAACKKQGDKRGMANAYGRLGTKLTGYIYYLIDLFFLTVLGILTEK